MTEISTRPEDWGSRVHPAGPSRLGGRACRHASTAHSDTYRSRASDAAQGWQRQVDAVARRRRFAPPTARLRRLVGTKVDITERKEAEESIRENEAVLRASHRRDSGSGRTADRVAGSRARAYRARPARRPEPADRRTVDRAQRVEAPARCAAGDQRSVPATMSSLQERALGLAENIRHLSHDLHPSVLQHAGLVAALTAHCAEIQRQYLLSVTFSAEARMSRSTPAPRAVPVSSDAGSLAECRDAFRRQPRRGPVVTPRSATTSS